VVADRAFVHLVLTNVAIIAVAWGVLPWVVPPFATASLHIGARAIGFLLLANAVTVVVAQVPIARLSEGRRRAVMMAIGALLIGAALLLVAVASSAPGGAYAALVVSSVAIGVGECFHTSALMPLVADLAPRHLRGRYMATVGFSWWIGLALAPIVGTRLLGVSATLTFAGSAAVAGAAALSLLALERRLPDTSRSTPRYVGSAPFAVSSPSRTSAATASSSPGS
jgi:MFS family permease